jgi:hypothetical protein
MLVTQATKVIERLRFTTLTKPPFTQDQGQNQRQTPKHIQDLLEIIIHVQQDHIYLHLCTKGPFRGGIIGILVYVTNV